MREPLIIGVEESEVFSLCIPAPLFLAAETPLFSCWRRPLWSRQDKAISAGSQLVSEPSSTIISSKSL